MSLDTIASSPVGIRMLDVLVSEGFASARPVSDLSEAALYDIAARAAHEVSSEKWSSSPGRFRPWEELASADKVEHLARAVPASAAARWWSDGIFDRPQVWLGREDAEPMGGQLHDACATKPRTQIWTSSALADNPSAWWSTINDGARYAPPNGICSIWQLTPDLDARVFEIRAPADYQWLCEMFPGAIIDGIIGPDWDAVAEHFDGIHLTVAGLIRTQGVHIETERGPAKLDDWDAESTAWLHWSFRAQERLGTIESEYAYFEEPPRRRFGRLRRRP